MSDAVVQMQCPRCMRVVYLAKNGVQHECLCVRCDAVLEPGDGRYCAACRQPLPRLCSTCVTTPCRCSQEAARGQAEAA